MTEGPSLYDWKLEEPGLFYRDLKEMAPPEFRHQYARGVTRPEIEPVFCGRAMIGTQLTGKTTTVFKLLGWGETREKAEAMAKGEK
jgi:hypothetical protein